MRAIDCLMLTLHSCAGRSDADPDVLADYVLALLRHDGDISDVRKLCEEEIPDFLKEGALSPVVACPNSFHISKLTQPS